MKQAGQLLCREMSGPAFGDIVEKDFLNAGLEKRHLEMVMVNGRENSTGVDLGNP
ncbi:hypothetical protein ACSYAY_07725 [Leptospirillum ferriphilum]|jgi:hypothetical protein|uniref:Uncharacterized protein n=1 Tax=Leptospirillum ferriphilum TaxID=178606 RepID=A0A094YMX9_9BACT|nr:MULTISPECIES: hypothetical protein [Leptospirillum]KGA94566.1 hypothetical protein LptCag_1996 [Leptospirillum ferriphilum]MCL5259666.1 hypothetical protein [Nitrospirota bacterium]